VTESSGEGERGAAMLMVRVLGPMVVERNGVALVTGGPRQRAVFARLAAADGQLVTADRLVEDLWGEDAPASILTTLHSYVSRLRTALQDPHVVRREGPGYSVELGVEQVDARLFERLAAQGRQALERDPATALDHLERALALWRGPAYADLLDMEWARVAATRLEESRWGVLELRFDAMLALGHHDAAVGSIESAIDDNPLRERFTAQLMLALYRCGRQSRALRAYDRTRRHLLDELGLDPSPELVRLQAAILAHEPWLAAPSPPRPMPSVATAIGGSNATGTGGHDEAPPVPTPSSPVALPPAVERHRKRPFVGRARELQLLRTAWQHVLEGQRRFAVIGARPAAASPVSPRGSRWRPTPLVRSCCGASPPPRPSSRTNHSSRRSAPCCGRCRRRPASVWSTGARGCR
jgi:DNA-binding SARP family transcriptional activator